MTDMNLKNEYDLSERIEKNLKGRIYCSLNENEKKDYDALSLIKCLSNINKECYMDIDDVLEFLEYQEIERCEGGTSMEKLYRKGMPAGEGVMYEYAVVSKYIKPRLFEIGIGVAIGIAMGEFVLVTEDCLIPDDHKGQYEKTDCKHTERREKITFEIPSFIREQLTCIGKRKIEEQFLSKKEKTREHAKKALEFFEENDLIDEKTCKKWRRYLDSEESMFAPSLKQ